MAETTKTKKDVYIEAVGRRKTASARVRITKATKDSYVINKRSEEEYFPTEKLRAVIKKPLEIAEAKENFSVSAIIKGGGISAQADALAMGIARALVKHDEETKTPIKKAGLLTRDARMKERRKFGLKKARKAPQWSKR